MTLNVHLDLSHKRELEAFARFCTDLASSADEVNADNEARQARLYGSAGLEQTINSIVGAPDQPEAELPAEAQAAKVMTEEVKPVRERGKPAPGRARRTKEEIAEDDAADAAEENEAKLNAGSFQPDQNISASPEDRVDPENSADAAQDEADEAAEAEASAGPITLDDIRKVVGEYQRDFGMDAATKDLPPVWRKICGEDCTKLSMIPEDKLAEVHAAIRAAHQKAGK